MSEEATRIDITKLESSLKCLISPENTFGAFKSCIFKTPEILRRHNKEAYAPVAFSIGPMHHGEPQLESAQKIKTLYLREFLTRSTEESPFDLTTVIEIVEDLESDARACYAERVKFTRSELIEILVVDGCFLIELLYRSGVGSDPDHPDDPIRNQACMLQYLYHDLVLLENQIPWVVLEGLFGQTIEWGPEKSTLKTLVVCLFKHHFSTNNPLSEPFDQFYKPHHILDFIRQSLVSPLQLRGKKQWRRTPSALALSEAGVNLATTTKRDTIFEITFDKKTGELLIPQLVLTEATEATFRNLISYEQCLAGCEPRVTSYVIVMDNLLDRLQDLDELCDKDILVNWLDPVEATKLFNNLYTDANVEAFHYVDLSADVLYYYNLKWPKWRAWFTRNYFTKPWMIISLFAGFITVVLTVVQTVFTIYSPGGKSGRT